MTAPSDASPVDAPATDAPVVDAPAVAAPATDASVVDAEDWLAAAALAPVADGSLAALYTGAADGRLVLPFCAGCGLALELEQRVCDGCARADVAWRDVPPTGTVHAATTVHRREPGLIRATEPYHVLDVEVASGHRLVMTTITATPLAPAIGQPVAIAFRTIGGVAVPAARLIAGHPPETEVSP
jgi:uncharacterized protein